MEAATLGLLLTIGTIASGTVIGQKINGLFGGGAKTSSVAPKVMLELLGEALRDPAVVDALVNM